MSRPPASPDRWTAVLNPAAGRGRARTRACPWSRTRSPTPTSTSLVHVSADGDDVRAIARAAFEAGRGVIACGGDGTVSAVAGLAADARRRDRHPAHGLRERPRATPRDPAPRSRRRDAHDRSRPRRMRRSRACGDGRRQLGLVHHRRQRRVRRGSQPLGEHRRVGHRHAPLRARGAAHAVVVPASTRAGHRRRRAPPRRKRGWSRSGTRGVTRAGW